MSISELYKAVNMITPASSGQTPQTQRPTPSKGPSEFEKVLDTQQVNLSKHAATRIRSRSLPWDGEMEKRVREGMDVAEKKGSQSALILAGDIAVIANIKSRTVVTALDKSEMKERVFTNIDSAVLV
ncbi:MAG: TIGR02530 family flagellar biosynthesis protein [Bdellovibrionota bacterium]